MPTIETNGVETYYERSGEGPPVVFVHGLGLDHRLWRPQVATLEAGYELVTYDYRGHGRTGPTDTAEYSVSLLAEDLRLLVEELGLDAPVLCAHSYGGLIAAEYAIEHPDEVRGIVFADARTGTQASTFTRVMHRLRPVLHRVEDAVGEARYERALSAVVDRVVDAGDAPDEGERVVPELGMTPAEYFEGTPDLPREEETKLMDAALEYVGASPTDFDVPVLYAYGEHTADVIAGKAARLRRAPTDVRVREISDAGHGLTMERPEAFDEVLTAFLADVVDRLD